MTPRRLIEPARLAGAAVLRTQSDDRLVDLVRDGNESAFEAIVHRYRRQLLRYCGRFLSPARAEDAVQQAFVNAYSALVGGDAEVNLRPWLYRIAHNAALNVMRAAGADHVQLSDQIDGVETPPQALERGERLRAVVTAVRELPDRQRSALVLQAVEGRSYDEIAIELGVSGGAVRQLLNRARTTLREGATALTPTAVVTRIGSALDAPVAQAVAGAGGGAALSKGIAVLAVAGAVVGSTTGGGHHAGHGAPARIADAPAIKRSGSGSGRASSAPARHERRTSSHAAVTHVSGAAKPAGRVRHQVSDQRSGSGDRSGSDGSRHSDGSGSRSGERSGSGSDSGSSGSSGEAPPTSGSDDVLLVGGDGSGSSGSGSGTSGSGDSGSTSGSDGGHDGGSSSGESTTTSSGGDGLTSGDGISGGRH